jgi:hypothetical protein
MGSMGSSAAAKALLVIGFLAAWIGYDAWLVSHVAFDPDATRSAAHALLDTPAVRHSLADQLTAQLEQRLPATANDPRVAPAVASALRDPRVTSAFADTVVNIHEAILSGDDRNTFTVDGRALTAALHDTLARSDPQLAAQVTKLPPLDLRIQDDKLPRVHDPRSATSGLALLAIIAAVLLITASLVLCHDRRSIARVGRRIAYLAITPLLVFLLLPRLLEHSSSDVPQITGTLLRTYGGRVLPSAITLVVVGAAIALGALAWPRHLYDDTPGSPPPPPSPGPPSGPPNPWGAPHGTGTGQPEITERLYL